MGILALTIACSLVTSSGAELFLQKTAALLEYKTYLFPTLIQSDRQTELADIGANVEASCYFTLREELLE